MHEAAPEEAWTINRNVIVAGVAGAVGLKLLEGVTPNVAKGLEQGAVGVFAGHFITAAYLHRARSHGSVEYVPPVDTAFRLLTHVAALGVDQEGFVKTHRFHHEYSDSPDDPHSPTIHGFEKVLFGYPFLVRRFKQSGQEPNNWSDWARPKDTLDRYYLDYPPLGWATGIAVHAAVAKKRGMNGLGLTVAVATHALGWLHETGRLTAHTHRRGAPENIPASMPLTHLMSGGESHHKLHHEDPGSARVGKDGRFDPAWWLIKGLSKFGLAKIKRP